MEKETESILRLLKRMGLDQVGSYLPIANKKNVELLQLLEKKQITVLKLHEELEDESSHCKTLRTNINSKLTLKDASQKAIQAKMSIVSNEKSILRITENGAKYVKRECTRLTKEVQDKKQKKKITVANLAKRGKVVQEISEVIKLDKQVVEDVKKSMKETDTELEAMQKYMKLDHAILQECELKEKKLIRVLDASKKQFEITLAGTSLRERELSRVTGDFRRIHKERNEAVNQWKDAIYYIKKKDSGIRAVAKDYMIHKQKSRTLDNRLEKRQEMWESCIHNLKAIEFKLQEVDRNVNVYQGELSARKHTLRMLTTEVTDSRYAISRQSEAVDQLDLRKSQLEREIVKIANFTKKLEDEVEDLRIQHPVVVLGKFTAEESLNSVYAMVEAEEEKVTAAKNNLEKQRGYYMNKLNEANGQKRKSLSMDHQLSASKNWSKNQHRQIKEMTYQLERKKHTLFKLQLEKHKHHNRLARSEYNRFNSNEDDVKMDFYNKNYLDACRKERTNLYNLKMLLNGQVGHLEQTHARMTHDISAQEATRAKLKYECKNFYGDNKRIAYQGAQLLVQHQNVFFEDQMLKIALNRLKMQIKQRDNKKHSLASKRALMQAVAKERKSEVDQHLKLLQMRKRELVSYASKLILQKRDVYKDIDIKKKGYDTVTSSMTTTEDREKGIRSEAQVILKHAQDRELMTREMKCWQMRIESTEAETVGLQNNLNLMTALNTTLKQNIAPILGNSEFETKIHELKKVSRINVMRRRGAMKSMIHLERMIEEMEFKISQLELTVIATKNTLQNKTRELNLINVEIANQMLKINRAKKVFEVESKSLRKLSKTERGMIETDLKGKCMREKFRFCLQHLDRLIGMHPKLKSVVKHMLRRSPPLFYISKDLEIFGHCAHNNALLGRPRNYWSPTNTMRSDAPSGMGHSPSHHQLKFATPVDSQRILEGTSSRPGNKKETTVEKLLKSMHATESVVAAEVKKEEYEKLKDSYVLHEEELEMKKKMANYEFGYY